MSAQTTWALRGWRHITISYPEGTAGEIVTTKGNYGSEMLYSYEKYYDANNGDDLILTLDTTVQYYLEKNMETAIQKYDVLNGAFGIVMNVNTGEILGMATLGSYDPNNYLEIYDDETAAGAGGAVSRGAVACRKDTPRPTTRAWLTRTAAVAAARLRQWRNTRCFRRRCARLHL